MGRWVSAPLAACLLVLAAAGCTGRAVSASTESPARSTSPASAARRRPPRHRTRPRRLPLRPTRRCAPRGRCPPAPREAARRRLLPARRADPAQPERVGGRAGPGPDPAHPQPVRSRDRRLRCLGRGDRPGRRGSRGGPAGPVDPARPVLAAAQRRRRLHPRQLARNPRQWRHWLRHPAQRVRRAPRPGLRDLDPALVHQPGHRRLPAAPPGGRPGVRAARPDRHRGLDRAAGQPPAERAHLRRRPGHDTEHRGARDSLPAGLGSSSPALAVAFPAHRAELLFPDGRQQPLPRGWQPLAWNQAGTQLLMQSSTGLGIWSAASPGRVRTIGIITPGMQILQAVWLSGPAAM